MTITPKKKVLFLITKGNWGGAQRYVFDVAASLPRESFDVVVACGIGDALLQKCAEAGVRCEQLPRLGRDVSRVDIAAFREIFRFIKTERPDILHLNSSKAAFLGVVSMLVHKIFFYCSRCLRTPYYLSLIPSVIFTVHGWPFNEPRGALAQAGLWFLSWMTAFLSDAVIVLCRADHRAARRMPFIAPKTHLIPNGIVPPHFTKRTEARRMLAPNAPEGAALIVTIAELTRNKGLLYALHAVSALSREADLPLFRFIIIGEGELRPELEEMIAKNNLGGVVRLARFIPDAKTLLSGADIFLLSSLKEGLPYVLLEAAHAGIPVVATNVGGIPDIVDDMQNSILIRAKREKEIADALRFLLIHRKKREELGAALREKVLREFGFEKMLAETVSLYES